MAKSAVRPGAPDTAKSRRPKFQNLPDPAAVAEAKVRSVNLLVAWVGHTDIRNIHHPKSPGPIRELLRSEYGSTFDGVHLIQALGAAERAQLPELEAAIRAEWHNPFTIHEFPSFDPIDYEKIFPATFETMRAVEGKYAPAAVNWHIHTSPGSSAMQASLLILGSTFFQPTTFYSTWFDPKSEKVHVRIATIPFALRLSNYTLASGDTMFIPGSLDTAVHFESILGHDPALEEVKRRAMIVAKSDARVVIQGESGTGKELFAKAIHDASSRKSGEYRAINCAALQNELVEIELFGAAAGAYTSCDKDRTGFLRVCDKGTLFLDELGELSAPAQAKLLRYLNDRKFYKMGSTVEETSDARILAATNVDLRERVASGAFRADLYYRLAECVLYLPPLRKREPRDLRLLAQHFLDEANERFGANQKTKIAGYHMKKPLGEACFEFLSKQPWNGNARELKLVLHRAALFNMDAEELTPAQIERELEPDFGVKNS